MLASALARAGGMKDSAIQIQSDLTSWLHDQAVFAWQYIWNPATLGTPFVCSPFVAKEILKYVTPSADETPRKYLEVGAGTGAMTTHLVKKLREGDTLDVVEIDEQLCDLLKKKFREIANVSIHHAPIQDWGTEKRGEYDVIISTVPLNSLPSANVLNGIFEAYKRLIKRDGYLSSVEYVGTSTLCQFVRRGEAKREFMEIFDLKNRFFNQYSFERPIVLANLPPARVTHCKISTTPPQ